MLLQCGLNIFMLGKCIYARMSFHPKKTNRAPLLKGLLNQLRLSGPFLRWHYLVFVIDA